jgi:hypothetical protein
MAVAEKNQALLKVLVQKANAAHECAGKSKEGL